MKIVKGFNDYIIDMILEKAASNDLPFVISDRLMKLLIDIKHPISKELMNYSLKQELTKYTLVDLHETESDMFTYSLSNKVFDYIATQTLSGDYETNVNKFKNIDYSELFKKNRVEIKIGKFIKRLFGDKFKPSGDPGKDVESFVTMVKSKRDKETSQFEIVEGDDIVKYYYKGNYTKTTRGGSTLHSSCMMYDYCEPYIGFYAVNKHKVKLIIMRDDKGDIKGRALLWDVDKIDVENVSRKFMDRVYTANYIDIEKFIKYAKDNNWLYKEIQNSQYDTLLIDPENEEKLISTIQVHDIKRYKAYPYLDTLKFFLINEGILTNDSQLDYDLTLESTSGGYTDSDYNEYSYDKFSGEICNNDDLIYCENEDIFISPEYAVWSDSDGVFMTENYAKENYKYSKEEEDWISRHNAVYIESTDDWVTIDTAIDNYIQCEYDKKWYSHDDSYPSEKWGCVPHDKVVPVITDIEFDLNEPIDTFNIGDGFVDARYEDDNTYFEVEDELNNKTFYLDNSLYDNFIINKIKKGDY